MNRCKKKCDFWHNRYNNAFYRYVYIQSHTVLTLWLAANFYYRSFVQYYVSWVRECKHWYIQIMVDNYHDKNMQIFATIWRFLATVVQRYLAGGTLTRIPRKGLRNKKHFKSRKNTDEHKVMIHVEESNRVYAWRRPGDDWMPDC